MATTEQVEAALFRLAKEIGDRVAAGVSDSQRERVLAELAGSNSAANVRQADNYEVGNRYRVRWSTRNGQRRSIGTVTNVNATGVVINGTYIPRNSITDGRETGR